MKNFNFNKLKKIKSLHKHICSTDLHVKNKEEKNQLDSAKIIFAPLAYKILEILPKISRIQIGNL